MTRQNIHNRAGQVNTLLLCKRITETPTIILTLVNSVFFIIILKGLPHSLPPNTHTKHGSQEGRDIDQNWHGIRVVTRLTSVVIRRCIENEIK